MIPTPSESDLAAAVATLQAYRESAYSSPLVYAALTTVLAALASAQRDGKRMDWLEAHTSFEFTMLQSGRRNFAMGISLRPVIDAAMSTTYRQLRHAMDLHNDAEDNLTNARIRLGQAEINMGKALRACREHRGISLRHCARTIGISAAYLSDVELGRRTITTGNLELYIGIILPHLSTL